MFLLAKVNRNFQNQAHKKMPIIISPKPSLLP